jgi:protein required for attachment to host cells
MHRQMVAHAAHARHRANGSQQRAHFLRENGPRDADVALVHGDLDGMRMRHHASKRGPHTIGERVVRDFLAPEQPLGARENAVGALHGIPRCDAARLVRHFRGVHDTIARPRAATPAGLGIEEVHYRGAEDAAKNEPFHDRLEPTPICRVQSGMTTTWIVSGDSSRARILQVTGRNRLAEIQDFLNPKGRADDRELITDAHPRFSGHGGVGKPRSRSTGGPASDRQETSAQEHEVELFAKQVDRFLDQARIKKRFDRLFVLAPPKFLGLLRKNLNKEVEKLLRDEIDKDLSWFDAREIDRFLKGDGTPMKYP